MQGVLVDEAQTLSEFVFLFRPFLFPLWVETPEPPAVGLLDQTPRGSDGNLFLFLLPCRLPRLGR